jgi:tRNA G18 (ribose-2'-O)-methylase SpoU
VIVIDDPHDPRLAEYRDLRSPSTRAAYEATEGTFIAEGVTVVRRLLASPLRTRSVLVLAGREDRVADVLPDDVPGYVATRDVLTRVAGFDVHRGVLACAERPTATSVESLAADPSVTTLAVLEGLNDHENLGAIARSARALGVDGLVLDPTCPDPWYRRAVRVSMGEMLFLPVARASTWPADLDTLRRHGFTVVALTPSSEAQPLAATALTRPSRVALLLGAEGPGLSARALSLADVRARIPMRGDVDSLNVGHAAAIAFAAFATFTNFPDGERLTPR